MFLYRLARALGMTVFDLRERLSRHPRELVYWRAFDRISPLPDPWEQTGIIAREVHNGWSTKPKAAINFMPIRVDHDEQQDTDEQIRIANQIFPEAFQE